MKSMTGYGSAHIKKSDYEIDVNIKSVNGRFLDVRFHLPRSYSAFEIPLKKKIAESLVRGTVDVYINRNIKMNESTIKISHQEAVAKKWLSAYKKMARTLKIPADLTLKDLVTLSPDLLKVDVPEDVAQVEELALMKTFEKALKGCVSERRREGLALQKQLIEMTSQLENQVIKMKSLRALSNKRLKSRFEERLKKLDSDLRIDEQRLATEVVFQMDKMDITEETDRLQEHTKSFKSLLKNKDPKGKKLDFYTQEFLREVNTVGSKSYVSQLTSVVVEAKSIVERIREQVQNIE